MALYMDTGDLFCAPRCPVPSTLAPRMAQHPEAERNGPAKELLDRLRAEEAGKQHFTYIILTLRDQHVEVKQ